MILWGTKKGFSFWCIPHRPYACVHTGGTVVENPPAKAGDMGSIPGSGRSPGGGNGNPLQCPCCDNPMDRGAWRAAVYGGLKELDLPEHAHSIYKHHESPGQSSTWELSVSLSTSLQFIWKLTVTLQRVLLSEIVFSIHFLSLLERKIHRERHFFPSLQP